MSVDHTLVKRFRQEVGDRLAQQRRLDQAAGLVPMTGEDERQFARAMIAQVLEEYARGEIGVGRTPPTAEEEEALAAGIHAALFGVGRLQPLLDDPEVENIDINGCDQVFVGYADGRELQADPVADIRRGAGRADPDPRRLLRPVLAAVRHRQPAARPAAARRLPALGGHGRHPPPVDLHPPRPARQGLPRPTWSATTRSPPSSARFLSAAVLARKNIMIAGATNAGKTTLLRALANEIPPNERLITVERALELGLDQFPELHPNVVAFEERLPNSEGQGEITHGRAGPPHPCA